VQLGHGITWSGSAHGLTITATAPLPPNRRYYGEFPLSFAACTGQKEIVAHLKRHGAAVNADRDMQ